MPLDSGLRLGPYEIVSPIGAEGDEVYKASDTEQNRAVAIKLLPPSLSEDSEMRQRFERDIKALSGLSHAHICTPYEIRREAGTDFLVMEYVEGETLAKRLERGALPLDEAVKIALALVDALHRAHIQGLVHRNLRPANIILTPGGAKLLDFALVNTAPSGQATVSATELRTKGTLPGVPDDIVRYMAPEQLEGREADARSDIFAFGAIVYEMVTGEKAFEGRNRPMLIAAITSLDPYPMSKNQPDSTPTLDHVVQRCLAKEPDDRWQTAHDLLVRLRWAAEGGDVLLAAARARQKRERRVLAVVAAAVFFFAVAATQAFVYWSGGNDDELFQLRVPVAGLSSSDISISPDGKFLAIVAKPNTQEPSWLFVRPVGSTEFRRLIGTEESAQPFWSPDSRSIGFTAGGRLKRVDATGGAPKDLGASPGFTGGAWSKNGIILFGSEKGLHRVSAEGGKPELITTVEKEEGGHFWPSFLPDGQHYLYLTWSADAANRAVFAGQLGSTDRTKVMAVESNAVYADPGYLLFHRQATLYAQPFNVAKLTAEGDPLHIADQVEFNSFNGRGSFDASQNGALVYFQSGGSSSNRTGSGGVPTNDFQFAWIDRATRKQIALVGAQGRYGDIEVSPDGKIAAITRFENPSLTADVWTLDWQSNRWFRLTLDPADDFNPIFSPDGTRVAFTSFRKGNADIYVKPANGSVEEVPLLETPVNEIAEDWSKDGKYIFYKSGDNFDIYALPLTGDKKPFPVVLGPFQKDEPQLSYDGKWLAYTTNQSGTFQVYVRSFPAGDQIIPISTNGGGQPRWRRDGKELFYRVESATMAVEISAGAKLEAGVPRQLFGPIITGTQDRDPTRRPWVIHPDGQRFLMRVALGQGGQAGGQGGAPGIGFAVNVAQVAAAGQEQGVVASGLTVIRNWPAAFRKELQ